mgnify:CR=1 FL=1
MRVRFIDTSIIMNVLEIPHMCADAEKIRAEFKTAVENGEILILPFSTIIESGNHIAHIADGTIRRERALKFREFLEKTANNEAPWKLYGVKLEKDDLLALAEKFPDYALRYEMGLGDLSIIHFYQRYKEETPAVGHIMIWSTDRHLAGFEEDVTVKRRRDR